METINTTIAISPAARPSMASAADDGVDVVCHEGSLPAAGKEAIDQVYAHLYCSPHYFEAEAAYADASLYVASRDGVPVAALPYKHDATEVVVVSEYLTLSDAELSRFATHMFERYPSVRRIRLPKVTAPLETVAFPCHATVSGEDMVVDLPPSVKDYETAVGKNMRRNIKRYTSALQKAFPSYRYELYLEQEIDAGDLTDIIALSCMRMQSKNIVPRFTETEIDWIVDFARKRGIVGVARIDGKVAAGAIGFRIGDNYFMHVIAHDPRFNDYSLGILCYYHTICEGIARGARRFHLLQGRYGYKYRLLAKRVDVKHADIYRNRLQFLAAMHEVARKEWQGRAWLLKQWLLHDVERLEGPGYRLLAGLVQRLRRAKRAKGLAGGDD
ncbi:GNAT family N-acetyltransferase [Noviherbaspirillum galbum]|uniref:GNAT family N-acetyltransferase n=1 Tax=Noviherbaspirillum galbum TaxID=2709383 RepID=A0A6B3SSR7_9BURK|nr:GNAT family N-acetyltransferase [Noviherbaspirillum galbum]NEX63518.1 GNAT family N-acetyltransferase [Noviherbaspirillum galbum]